jgi:hypothetical protein
MKVWYHGVHLHEKLMGNVSFMEILLKIYILPFMLGVGQIHLEGD